MRLSGIGYKSLIIAGALTLFALPALAYTRTPAGDTINNPVSFTLIPVDLQAGGYYWDIDVMSARLIFFYGENLEIISFCYNSLDYPDGFTDIETLPLSAYIVELDINSDSDCSYTQGRPEIDGFTVIPLPPPPAPTYAFATPTSTAPNLLAAISDQFADAGFLWFAIISAGILLGFWVMESFLDLLPKDKI